ncbi:hypothetical protein [Acinetobacter pittii]|uniref:hypothetical protein n=1 Tax=Acinetobacter pittii TaxID=48296 RepID=UPI00300B0A0E
MDNYKIKVKDEARANEARDLFKALGYHPDNSSYEPYVEWVAVFEDRSGSFYSLNMDLDECEELTLPQLRDLVVLKRNDINDAKHICDRGLSYFVANDGDVYQYTEPNGWGLCRGPELERIKEIWDVEPTQDQALISGADALRALADGKWVIGKAKDYESGWHDAKHWTLTAFLEDTCYFKIKPATIKVNSELPKPNKETQHNSLVYAVTYEFKTREERNAFADKLRGTNS